MADTGVRLTDLLVALSLATDLGLNRAAAAMRAMQQGVVDTGEIALADRAPST